MPRPGGVPTVPVPASPVSCFLRGTKPHPKASQRVCSGHPVRSQRLVSPVRQRALLGLGADNNVRKKRWGSPIPIFRVASPAPRTSTRCTTIWPTPTPAAFSDCQAVAAYSPGSTAGEDQIVRMGLR